MFQYCPSCASTEITMRGNRLHCPRCGFVYYHNTAAATGCVISAAGGLLLLVRGKEPALGKLDLPGGFVNPAEGALEGLVRELEEEIGWKPPLPPGAPLTEVFTLFASFPNVYPYRNITYNTCDLFFSLSAPDLRAEDLRLQKTEIAGVRLVRPREIDFGELAFESTKRALRAWIARFL